MPDRPLPPILARIRATKEEEVAALLAEATAAEWTSRANERTAADPPRDFFAAITAPTDAPLNLIAEIKKASPSKGVIREDFDPPVLARAYEEGGASAISCLTDATYFQGCAEFLAAARTAVALPVLRKDFLIHPVQIAEARTLGADAVLLIARMLTGGLLAEMLALTNQLGMSALTEIHDEEDLALALDANAPLLGINNRDLDSFVVDLSATPRLKALLPQGVPVVAESGIFTREDILHLAKAGCCAALVGESLMRQDDVAEAARHLLHGS